MSSFETFVLFVYFVVFSGCRRLALLGKVRPLRGSTTCCQQAMGAEKDYHEGHEEHEGWNLTNCPGV